MRAPGERAVTPERLEHLVEIHEARRDDALAGRHEHRRILVGEGHGLLRRQLVGALNGLEVSRSDISIEPLAHQTRMTTALRGEGLR